MTGVAGESTLLPPHVGQEDYCAHDEAKAEIIGIHFDRMLPHAILCHHMQHQITIQDEDESIIYQQKVENLDLVGVISAINRPRRAPRSDKGKSRREEANATAKPEQ